MSYRQPHIQCNTPMRNIMSAPLSSNDNDDINDFFMDESGGYKEDEDESTSSIDIDMDINDNDEEY
eukprot:CAMPEP_0204621126 /NCGR_PEP_ID=MMETSP0717-20131115/6952_1 /ASSEMBLY_ACC=CAM_ASM_000666 /TAXON_ID=230516 /ORGANISM="Chaetoceros curvisetus" /LENGTH=65 /DNA_ID=CAMNT_0051635479 /DNA_START=491 /DNA_END=685 /DNA_ORIENTATION=+